jgi:hypothetical protein
MRRTEREQSRRDGTCRGREVAADEGTGEGGEAQQSSRRAHTHSAVSRRSNGRYATVNEQARNMPASAAKADRHVYRGR